MTEPRRTWPTPMSTAGVGEGHTHELPEDLVERVQGLHQRVRRATVINIINLLLVGGMVVFLALFIQNRGVDRDRQIADTNRQINDQFCALLGLAPADSPQADYYREQLNCPQPGVATDQLPPEIQQRYAPTPVPVTPAAPSPVPLASPPPLGSPAVPGVQRPVPNVPPPTEPAPDPLVDLGPITDLLPLDEPLQRLTDHG